MSTVRKILKIPLRISVTVALFGMLAKILEWPYSKEIMLLGFSATTILYVFRFLKKSPKIFIDYTKLVLVFFWSTNGIFRVLNFPYTLFFQIITGIAFVTWFLLEGTAYFLDKDRRAKNSMAQILWNFVLILGTLGLIGGTILKILDWDYAIHLLSLGITLIGAYVLKDVFIPSEPNKKEGSNEEFQL